MQTYKVRLQRKLQYCRLFFALEIYLFLVRNIVSFNVRCIYFYVGTLISISKEKVEKGLDLRGELSQAKAAYGIGMSR